MASMSFKSAIYVVARVSHLLQGSLVHRAYLHTRDPTIPRHTPTREPTVCTAERLDVGLDSGKEKQLITEMTIPLVGSFIHGLGNMAIAPLVKDRGKPSLSSYRPHRNRV